MKSLTVIAIALAVSTPAKACHRFSRWYYPYPQRCTTAHATEPDRSWYVEFVLPEPPPAPLDPTREVLRERLAAPAKGWTPEGFMLDRAGEMHP